MGGPGLDILQGGPGADTPDIGPLDFTINIQDTGGRDNLRLEPVLISPNPSGYLYLTPILTGLSRQGNDLRLDVWLRSDLTNAPDLRGQVYLRDQFTLGEIETINISRLTLTTAAGALNNPGVYYDTAYPELPWSDSPSYGTWTYYWRRRVDPSGGDYLERAGAEEDRRSGGGFTLAQPLYLRLVGTAGPAYRLAA